MTFMRTATLCLLFAAGLHSAATMAAVSITVEAGDNQGLIDAINNANANGEDTYIDLVPDADGNAEFVFDMPYQSTGSALPEITSKITFRVASGLPGEAGRITIRRAENAPEFRAFHINSQGSDPDGEVARVVMISVNIVDFSAGSDGGGAFLVSGNGTLSLYSMTLAGNESSGNGGAIRANGRTAMQLSDVWFVDNHANQVGGSISLEGNAQSAVSGSRFENNRAGVFGCDINVASNGATNGEIVLGIQSSMFEANCSNVTIENPFGGIYVSGSTFFGTGEAFDSTDVVYVLGNVFDLTPPQPGSSEGAVGGGAPVTKALCNDFGIGVFVSLGYNIASVDGCGLDDPTDQVNTDPGLVIGQDGFPVPGPNSPVIESGDSEVVVVDGGDLATLPCGYADMTGLGRPQDADGDGEFVCDRGAIEVAGSGVVSAGHSGAYYNAARNGEGNYVEILSDDLAVVYTFSYRPDGSGPSWFVGAGAIRGNSIVIDELQRPTGTSFGAGFDVTAIERTPAGAMSMVFPDCDVAGMGGSVAYTGEPGIGYEGVLTRAQRLSRVTGCDFVPSNNAGLSGSYFTPDRDGEGLIVEWLDNGMVTVIFFTFDTEGDQFWVTGTGTPDGHSVTMEVYYPETSTRWGRDFDPDEYNLEVWGTFTLDWSDCNNLAFSYDSTVSGYGSGSHAYTRISRLQETGCPAF